MVGIRGKADRRNRVADAGAVEGRIKVDGAGVFGEIPRGPWPPKRIGEVDPRLKVVSLRVGDGQACGAWLAASA